MKEEIENEQGDFEINLDKNYKPKKKIESEDQEEFKPIKFKTAFWSILGLHVFALAGIAMYSAHSKAQASIVEEDKKFLQSDVKMVGVEYPETKVNPTPTPEQKKEVAKPNATPKPKVIQKIPENISPNYPNPKYTTEYVVKQGDTFTKIVKMYGLNAEKLKKINNIKDENKLMVGQKLKFM
jgi:LysM repeat protein